MKLKINVELYIEEETRGPKNGVSIRACIFPSVSTDVQKLIVSSITEVFDALGGDKIAEFAPCLKLDIELSGEDLAIVSNNDNFPTTALKGVFIQKMLSGEYKGEASPSVQLPFVKCGYFGYFLNQQKKDGAFLTNLRNYVDVANKIVSNIKSYAQAVSIFDYDSAEDREAIESLIKLYSPHDDILKGYSAPIMAALLLSLSKNFNSNYSISKVVELLLVFEVLDSDGSALDDLVAYSRECMLSDSSCPTVVYAKKQIEVIYSFLNSVDAVSRYRVALSDVVSSDAPTIDFYGTKYIDFSNFQSQDAFN